MGRDAAVLLAHYVVSSAGLFQKYLVLHTVDRRGRWHPTVPAEVVPVQMANYPHGAIPFRLSTAAVEHGAVRWILMSPREWTAPRAYTG